MSTYYYLVCDKCKKRSGCFHAQQAWGSWTDKSEHEFLEEHRDHEPIVVSENDSRTDIGEYEEQINSETPRRV